MKRNPHDVLPRLKDTVNKTRLTFSWIVAALLKTTGVDDGNFGENWHRKHPLVVLCGGPQEVGGDSTLYSSLLRMWQASQCCLRKGLTPLKWLQHLHQWHWHHHRAIIDIHHHTVNHQGPTVALVILQHRVRNMWGWRSNLSNGHKAELYEYWIFYQIFDFCCCHNVKIHPPVQSLMDQTLWILLIL